MRWSAVLLAAVLLVFGVGARCAAQQSPSPAVTTLLDAQTLTDAGKLDQAEAATRAFLAGDDDSADGHYLLAFILFREDKPKPSLAEYTRAAALQRPTAEQLRFVAYDYVLANDYADADTWMTRAVTWKPDDSELWYGLGRIKNTENRFAEGADCFKHALALSPKLVKAEDNLGISYEGLNRTDDAIAAYRTAIAWQQGVPDPSEQPLLNLGKLLADGNQMAQALPLLEQAEAIAPKNAVIHAALGRVYTREGNAGAAQRELEQAVALAPNNAGYHFQLGQAYRNARLTEKAKVEFDAAAQLDATHSSH